MGLIFVSLGVGFLTQLYIVMNLKERWRKVIKQNGKLKFISKFEKMFLLNFKNHHFLFDELNTSV